MSTKYDLAILGGGPAGYSAAIYAARAGLDCAVIEQSIPGGQITTTERVDNYPGIPGVSGIELGDAFKSHADSLGTKTILTSIESLDRTEDGSFLVKTLDGDVAAQSIIAALGATPKTAGFKGEDKFRGRGVSYCATCDGMFFRNKEVFVVGGGNSACEEAIFLAGIAKKVTVLVRRDQFRAPRGVWQQLLTHENITIRYQTVIEELKGDALPESIVLKNTASGAVAEETYTPGSFGIFVFVGTQPQTDLIDRYVKTAPDGSVITDEHMATKTPGLYAAGDIRNKPLRQVITAASDGAIAATSVYTYLNNLSL